MRATYRVLALLLLCGPARADDGNAAAEAALKAAAAAVGPSVVRIETSGGLDMVGAPAAPGPTGPGGPPAVRKGIGPTTGLVVGADGYVISSAFNFANKPADVFVTVPGRPRLVAKVVATDTTRMLTLLKVDATGLPVPAAVPRDEIVVGRWAVALGRALGADASGPPSMSVGIVSSTGRIFGKVIQCDAKVSPVNYGGPLVAADGKVFGVLVPASPRGETETAGVEWYDSGIGFAVPLGDVFAAAERLKRGKDLRRGLLGVTAKVQEEQYNLPATIGAVSKDSAAEKAGIKAGDTVVAIDGRPVTNMSEVQHALGPKYDGDTVAVRVKRGDQEIAFAKVALTGAITSFAAPFLGILPLRDDPGPGVEVRHVYPASPAATAGLGVGDRVIKIGPAVVPPGLPPEAAAPAPVTGRDAFATLLTRLSAGTDITLEVKRKGGKVETLTVKLGTLPDELPAAAPLPSSAGRALERAGGKPPVKAAKMDEPEKGLVRRTSITLGRETWAYVPENYDRNVAHGVVVWLHRANGGGKDADDMVRIFQTFCENHHFILIGPKAKNAEGWVPSETEEVLQEVKALLADYTIDKSRVIVHGMGNGGQMAFYLGFAARDFVRAVAVTGAVLGTQPKEPVPGQPLQFFVVGGEQDPLVKEIAAAKPRLVEKKYPVVYRQLKEFGKEYLLETTLDELMRWMDSLDRL